MQFANIIVSIVMALLGYVAFIYTTGNYKPLNIPAKSSLENSNVRNNHLLGLLAGGLVALSSLATWALNSGSVVAGLKASFIAAAISLLLLLAMSWLRGYFAKRADIDTEATHQSNEKIPNDDVSSNQMLHAQTELAGSSLDEIAALQKSHEDELEIKLRNLDLVVQEKTEAISNLENTITKLQNENVVLTERTARLDNAEAELQSVRDELTTQQTRDRETIGFSQKTIESLQTENKNLLQEVEQAQQARVELDNHRLELQQLKSVNERHEQNNNALEEKENELHTLRQELESKDKAHNNLINDLTKENEQIRSNVQELEYLKSTLANNEQASHEALERLQQAALEEREGRLKMEASAKRAADIARHAIGKLHEHEKRLMK